MFDSLTDDKLRAAQEAARLLYEHHRALGIDALAIKLDTLSADIANALGRRGVPGSRTADDPVT
jgi:hypothetical protein